MIDVLERAFAYLREDSTTRIVFETKNTDSVCISSPVVRHAIIIDAFDGIEFRALPCDDHESWDARGWDHDVCTLMDPDALAAEIALVLDPSLAHKWPALKDIASACDKLSSWICIR